MQAKRCRRIKRKVGGGGQKDSPLSGAQNLPSKKLKPRGYVIKTVLIRKGAAQQIRYNNANTYQNVLREASTLQRQGINGDLKSKVNVE